MSQTLREFIEMASAAVEPIFNAKGAVYPMYHWVADNGQHNVLSATFKSKDQQVAMMRALFKEQNARRFVFIDEAWVKWMDPSIGQAGIDAIMKAGIRNDPQRIEVVLFAAEDRDGGTMTGERRIIRKINSRPRLGSLTIYEPTYSEGRMVGMLPRGKLSS